MNIDKLKKDTYEALKQYFNNEESVSEEHENLLCAVPTELLISIVENLVLPVLSAVIASFLINKFTPKKQKNEENIIKQLEKLSEDAKGEIGNNLKKIGMSSQRTQEVIQHVSLEVNVVLRTNSEEELLKAFWSLKELEKGAGQDDRPAKE